MEKKTVEDKNEPSKGTLDKMGIKDKDQLAAQIRRDFNDAEEIKYSWIPERNEDVKNYHGVTKSSEWPFKGASQVKSQFFRIVVDVLSGNLCKSFFLPEKPIAAKVAPLAAGTPDTALQNIKYVEDLHNAEQTDDYKLKVVLDKAIPTALIESFVVLHPTWEYLTTESIFSVKRWVPGDVDVETITYDTDSDTVTTQEGEFVPSIDLEKNYMTAQEAKSAGMKEVQFDVTKEECQKDGISVKVINGYRFYMPLNSPGETPYEKVQRAPYVIHELYYSIREFEQLKEEGYFEDVDPALDDCFDPQKDLITYTKYVQAGYVLDVSNTKTQYIRVHKWSGKWKIGGKWREIVVWKDKNTNAILRVEPNVIGIRPYFPIVPLPIDDTPYGESVCKVLRVPVKEIDLLLRCVTNIALQKAAPPKFYDPASGFNPSTVGQFGPNSWIPAREPARNVLIPPQPEDPNVALQMIQLLINLVERMFGVSEVVQGQISDRANTTATEVQNSLVRSGVRFDQIFERLKEQLNPMFPYIDKLLLRHMSPAKEKALMGMQADDNRFTQIHNDRSQGAYIFTLAGNSVVMEQQELQNALALYNTLLQGPGLAYTSYKPESIYYLLYNIVKRLNPIAMDKILPTPQEVQQLERDRQMVTQEQEQVAKDEADQSGQAEAQAAQMQMEMQAQQAQMEMQMKQAETQQKLQQSEQEHDQKLRQAEETHNQKMQEMKEMLEVKKEAARAQAKKTAEKPKPKAA